MLHHIHNDETYSLFIDGANLYSAARLLGFDIDYKKLLQSLSGHGRLVRTYYYTAIMENQDYSPIRPLVDWLDYNGYTVITKPAKEFIGDEGKRRIKGDMDVEIAVDMLELSERLDHVVLFSGDGDFRHLVEAVQRKNTRVTVVSTVQSNPPMAADEIRRQADFFVELNDLADCITKKRLGKQNFDTSADDFESFEDNFNDEAVVEVA